MAASISHVQVWWGVKSALSGRFYSYKDRPTAEMELLRAPTGSTLITRTVVHIDEEIS